ncbi:MAG: RluA family pseudouridine synthase [Chitinophagaceae bacterium]
MIKLTALTIFENDDFIALNKPPGVLSIPDRTQSQPSLKDHLIEKYGEIFTVHRLDKDTSGVIVFAKNEAAHRDLSLQFENRQTGKIYYGVVSGTLPDTEGLIDVAIAEHPHKKGMMVPNPKGKPSQTEYKVLESFGIFSYLQFTILTGRTHQIRVHMKHLGNPIACDQVYGDGKPVLLSMLKKKFKLSKDVEEERPILSRLALHSAELSFTGPNGETHRLQADLPKDLRAFLQQLRKWKA